MTFSKPELIIKNPVKIDEGWRGVIYAGEYKGKKVSLKIAKSQENIEAINKEAGILEILRGKKEFPQILERGNGYFIYEFIEGAPFKSIKDKGIIKEVLKRLVDIARFLDISGINHGELNNIEKNVLVNVKDSNIDVYLLDFDRGGFSKKTHNVSQLIQVLRKHGILSLEEAIKFGKEYFKEPEKVVKELKYLTKSTP